MKTKPVPSSDDWETPQDLFDDLNLRFHFDLDAAADRKNSKCSHHLGPGAMVPDALSVTEWSQYGRSIFVNPPYSKAAGPLEEWVKRMYLTTQTPNRLVVAILPATPNTLWFHRYVVGSAAVFFPRGRVKFTPYPGADFGSARHDTMLVMWGLSPLEGNWK